MYLVLAERSFVSRSLMVWSWLVLCSATVVYTVYCTLIHKTVFYV